MKILVIHNHYLERGGEDEVAEAEVEMLKKYGHEVIFYERANEEIKNMPLGRKIKFFTKEIVFSKKTYNDIRRIVQREKPDIAHLHNIFIVVSPSVYYALAAENIPVVQSLHNYRLVCPCGTLYRNGSICEECSPTNYLSSLIHRCWRGSFILTASFAGMLMVHFKKMTFQEKVDTIIASSEFSRMKLAKIGLPEEKFFLKPNFVEMNSAISNDFDDYGLFLGRLVDYKGINTLISAYERLNNRKLKIIGSGPMLKGLKKIVAKNLNIELLGRLPYEDVVRYMKKSSFVVFPTECYEAFGRVVIEAFACGVPVIATNIGAGKELIDDGETGLLFNYKNSDELAEKVDFLMNNRALLIKMRKNARQAYEEKYTLAVNYKILMDIYAKAIHNHKSKQAMNWGGI